MTNLSPQLRQHLQPSVFWGIRQKVPLWLQVLLPILGLAVPLLIWIAISSSGITSTTFLPPPDKVLEGG